MFSIRFFFRLRAWDKQISYLPALGRYLVTCGLGQHFQDLGHSFSLYGPPSPQITYMYCYLYTCVLLNCVMPATVDSVDLSSNKPTIPAMKDDAKMKFWISKNKKLTAKDWVMPSVTRKTMYC